MKRYGVKCKSRDTQLSRGRSHGSERAARRVCGLLARRSGRSRELWLIQPFLGTELASVVCILAAAIPAAIGFVSFHGLPFEKFALSWLRTMFMHNGWYVYRSVNFYAQFTPEEQSKKGRSRKKTKQKISEHSNEVEQNEQNQTD